MRLDLGLRLGSIAGSTHGAGVDPLEISGAPVLTATENVAYAGFTVSATGGNDPYTYSIAAGSLPPGVTLNTSTGEVSGTPVNGGTFSGIVIRVTDDDAATADLDTFAITVTAVDELLLSGDMQDTGFDALALSGDMAPGNLLIGDTTGVPTYPMRFTQVYAEAILVPASELTVTQVYAEAIITRPPSLTVTQVYLEVILEE